MDEANVMLRFTVHDFFSFARALQNSPYVKRWRLYNFATIPCEPNTADGHMESHILFMY